jgi:hypothetical protein
VKTNEEVSFITKERRRIVSGFHFRTAIKLVFAPLCQEKIAEFSKKKRKVEVKSNLLA